MNDKNEVKGSDLPPYIEMSSLSIENPLIRFSSRSKTLGVGRNFCPDILSKILWLVCVLPYHAESETRLDCGSIICGCCDSCLHLVAGVHNQDQTTGVASL